MSDVTIKVRDNGPFLVEGPITIVDASGGQFVIPAGKPAVALCRCGQSKNKPFCDGSHKTCSFMAAERAPAGTAPAGTGTPATATLGIGAPPPSPNPSSQSGGT